MRPPASLELTARAVVVAAHVAAGLARAGGAAAFAKLRRRERPRVAATRAIAGTLERLGPTYVKLGQILGTRRDLLPGDVVAELERLHDRLEAPPFAVVPPIVRAELGRELADVFRELDPVPLASASIATVYEGVLHDGTRVAVKVRRPAIVRRVELDLRLLALGAAVLSRLPGLRALPLTGAIDEFGACLRHQLDFRREADANRRLSRALAREPNVVVPMLIDDCCSESILTMERAPIEAAARDERCRPALVGALRALYQMIFIEGFVHCDLHRGNLLLLPDGRAVFLDFGFMAELPRAARLAFAEFFYAFSVNDGRRCAQITVRTAARVPPGLRYREFERELAAVVAEIAHAPVEDFRVAGFVAHLFDIQRRHRIVGTTAFTMAIVSLLVFEGIANEIAGTLDFQREAFPFLIRAALMAFASPEQSGEAAAPERTAPVAVTQLASA